MNYKFLIIIILFTAGILSLIIWGNSRRETIHAYFKDTEIACLTNGHQRLAEHIHPKLIISVDGQNEIIPANIGIEGECMSEIHTHDETGVLHLESFLPNRISNYHIGHLFEVWDKNHTRDGYNLEIIQDGEIKNSIEEVKFIDQSIIEFRYTSIDSETN